MGGDDGRLLGHAPVMAGDLATLIRCNWTAVQRVRRMQARELDRLLSAAAAGSRSSCAAASRRRIE
jgi:hypothetical protein